MGDQTVYIRFLPYKMIKEKLGRLMRMACQLTKRRCNLQSPQPNERTPSRLLAACNVRYCGFGNTQIVFRTKNHLGSANAGRDGNGVPQLDGFVGEDRKSFLGAQHGHAAANVSSEPEQFLDGNKFHFAVARGRCEGFEIKLSIGGNHSKAKTMAVAARQQSFKDLLRR